MDEYLQVAKRLARRAGQMIEDGSNRQLNVELKADHSPVTQVDKAINDMVITAIRETYPEHGIMGEEASFGSGQEELQWLCDPLDGTKAYTVGIPVTTFILGLVKGGEVQLAVVYHPFTDRMYHAIRGHGAFCNEKPIRVGDQSLAVGGCVLVYESYAHYEPKLKALGGQVEPCGGAGFRAALVASGKAAGIIQGPNYTDFHDVGPASLIVEEAGGTVTDLAGQPLRFDKQITNGIILSNASVHNDLLDLVKAQ